MDCKYIKADTVLPYYSALILALLSLELVHEVLATSRRRHSSTTIRGYLDFCSLKIV